MTKNSIEKKIREIFENNTIGNHLNDSVTYSGQDIDNIVSAILSLVPETMSEDGVYKWLIECTGVGKNECKNIAKALTIAKPELSEDMTSAYTAGFEKGKDSVKVMSQEEVEKVIFDYYIKLLEPNFKYMDKLGNQILDEKILQGKNVTAIEITHIKSIRENTTARIEEISKALASQLCVGKGE